MTFDAHNLESVQATLAALLLSKPVEPRIEIPQPNTNGEFPSPADGAIWMATTYGIPQTPLKGKAPFLQNWPVKASTDPSQIRAWAAEYPGCNFGSVAVAGKHFIFEADSVAVRKRFKNQGHDFTSSLIIESSPGKGHRYYLSAPGVENIGQNKGEDFSIRANGEQCVSPGSVHPVTGRQYRVAVQNGSLAQPTPEEIVFWNGERVEGKSPAPVSTDEPILQGKRNATITSILGKARQQNALKYDALLALARQHNQLCSPPLPESELEVISRSIANYAVKEAGQIVFEPAQAPVAEIVIPKVDQFKYPVFPSWIMKGCSMYDGYIKPLCDQNSRYPEMMFVPGLAILLNYLGTKLRIGMGKPDGAFVVLIGKKGRMMKSSSVQDMLAYYQFVGILDHHTSATRNAEGKTLVWTAGSTEGVGNSAQRANCKNILSYFDELKTMSDKAGIEGSSMGAHYLTMLQSGKWNSETRTAKTNFSFSPGEYSASIIACCTDRMFPKLWSKLIAFSDGMEDRATLIFQPEQLKEMSPRVYIAPTTEQIAREKQLIADAVNQKDFQVETSLELAEFGKKYGPRSMARATEWALALAVQRRMTVVDEGCIERGIALEKYNIEVKRYLNVREAETKEAVVQNQIIQILMHNQGRVSIRELNKRMRPDRLGTFMWSRCYGGLIQAGITTETGSGKPGPGGEPKMLVLLQVPEHDDD
jgi:hypothetical protein